jgi:hypothetical protein
MKVGEKATLDMTRYDSTIDAYEYDDLLIPSLVTTAMATGNRSPHILLLVAKPCAPATLILTTCIEGSPAISLPELISSCKVPSRLSNYSSR